MEYKINEALSFDDVLLVPRYSDLKTRKEADISTFGFANPIGMTPMDTVTSPAMIRLFLEKGMLASVHRYFKTPQEQYDFACSAFISDDIDKLRQIYFAVGSSHKYKYWIDWLFNKGINRFIVDMAHGESTLCVDTVKYIKTLKYDVSSEYCFPIGKRSSDVIAGNVVTKAGFNRLQEAGANGIRVGVGSGSICTTRTTTGFGLPQLSAISDCARVRNSGVMVIACGGIKTTGDMAKAMAVGADMCFMGKRLAATDLASGRTFDKNMESTENEEDIVYKEYRGMSSREARAGVMEYSSVEGVAGKIYYNGRTTDFIRDVELNLRSAMSYGGSRSWDEFRKKVKIVKISNSAISESQTHLV